MYLFNLQNPPVSFSVGSFLRRSPGEVLCPLDRLCFGDKVKVQDYSGSLKIWNYWKKALESVKINQKEDRDGIIWNSDNDTCSDPHLSGLE
jgi:hypothetical protein